ncbi:uncharacterized protein EDB93DRAFT_1254897 [Suillus bovinus]|uniref:uncharacterized protein n=1 Tax=Suillus bovinus TaxID=48563 RepID=UPI001B8643E8|nr:uncharacterized protein EDB93DRAFT_1254897 [Suillus bovinus]KAG2133230.1 hypothetical protein EDB93DRAFT_1254897 [Suillus bovinus]
MAPSGAPSPTPTAPMGITTRTSWKTTASKPLLSFSKSLEDHAIGTGTQTDINSTATARKLLTTHGLTIPVAGNALKEITAALFELSLTPNTGATLTEILRSFAFILHEDSQTCGINNILTKVDSLIKNPIEKLENNVKALTQLVEMQKTTMEETVKEVHNQMNMSPEGIEKALESAIQKTNQQSRLQTELRGSEGPRTYADAIKAGTPAQLTKILARNEAQTRQILIDRRSLLSPNSLRDLTESQLVTKASMALELMTQQNIKYPQDLSFVSARRLPHGGILHELNTKESAEWFNTPANKSNFLEFYGTNVTIKDRSFHILMENVPISFVPNNPAALVDIEKKAGLPQHTITKARYIKPIEHRNPNQQTAHIAITFTTKVGANQAIRFSLSVDGKKVYGHKLLLEPTRCLRCHSFDGNHLATDCQQEKDTCGTCGEDHCTNTCSVTDPTLYYCINCKEHGHATWSRDCPTFVKKWEAHKDRNAENKYIYFPTEDPLTWETLPEAYSNWEDAPPPNFTNETPPTQQNTRYPPPQRNRQERCTVDTDHRNNPPSHLRNPNNIPLGPKTQMQT